MPDDTKKKSGSGWEFI